MTPWHTDGRFNKLKRRWKLTACRVAKVSLGAQMYAKYLYIERSTLGSFLARRSPRMAVMNWPSLAWEACVTNLILVGPGVQQSTVQGGDWGTSDVHVVLLISSLSSALVRSGVQWSCDVLSFDRKSWRTAVVDDGLCSGIAKTVLGQLYTVISKLDLALPPPSPVAEHLLPEYSEPDRDLLIEVVNIPKPPAQAEDSAIGSLHGCPQFMHFQSRIFRLSRYSALAILCFWRATRIFC